MSLQAAIKKRFSGFSLDVSLNTNGGVMGILGASGSGKSMTLKCIAGIETPDEGRIVLNGRVLFDSEKHINLPPQKRKVGYLFQNYALFPNMTVETNIAAGLSGSKEEKQEAVARMIRLFKLEGLEKRYPSQLSGGQQQRVALARILVYEPDVIMLDEPFSALDYYLKEQLQFQVREVLRGYTGDVLMVSHSRDEVYRFCEKSIILNRGQVAMKGETRAIFQKPENVTAARLTGCKNFSRIRRIGEYEVVVILQRTHLHLYTPVLIKEVHRAQDGAVTDRFAHVGKSCIKFLLVHIAQNSLSEVRCDILHLCRDRRVFSRQVGVIRAGVNDAERIAAVGKIMIDLLDDWTLRVCKINEDQSADAGSHLIHQAGCLAEIHVFSILTDLRDFDHRDCIICEQAVEDSADQDFKRRRAGKPRPGQHRGLHLCVKA